MPDEVWFVESEEFSIFEVKKRGQIRQLYIETLEKVIENLKKENNFKLESEKNYEPLHGLPTILYCDVAQSFDNKRGVLQIVCYTDRKIFRESVDWDSEKVPSDLQDAG